MKFILAFTVCSAITGLCNNTSTLPTKYDSWAECVGAGGILIQDFSVELEDKINKEIRLLMASEAMFAHEEAFINYMNR